LDANRTPEFAMPMPLFGCHAGLILSEDPKLRNSFDYCACVRLLRLHIIVVEVYCHVCHC
jgi:hypothetical protein